jgi:hypothetical protein
MYLCEITGPDGEGDDILILMIFHMVAYEGII